MKYDDPELLHKVLALFRRGFDTKGISISLLIEEHVIERMLHAALSEYHRLEKNGAH